MNWMTFIMMAFVCASFAACGSSDDDNDNDNGSSYSTSNPLVGVWKAKLKESQGKGNMFLEFKANGSGREYYDQYDAVEKFNYVVIAYSNELKKGVVRITLSDGQSIFLI